MGLSPSFVVAGIVCALPFALAIRDELRGRHDGPADDSAAARDALEEFGREQARLHPTPDLPDDYTGMGSDDLPTPVAPSSRNVTAAELHALIGTAPATMGPMLEGVTIGASSLSYLSDQTQARIDAFKLDYDISVDFDADNVALNSVTVRVTGDEPALRDAMIAAWGTPRRLTEDLLVWTGTGSIRAAYSAMPDGFDLRWERFSTIDELIAPHDRTKLGVEPFPVIGATTARLETALGARLDESSLEDGELSWTAPGVQGGTGTTTIRVTLDDNDDPAKRKVITLHVEGETTATDELKDALIAKWGPPKDPSPPLSWLHRGEVRSADLTGTTFTIDVSK